MSTDIRKDRYPSLIAQAELAAAAGREILKRRFEEHKLASIQIEIKEDGSPVSAADKESDAAIRAVLADTTGIPVISEEIEAPYDSRRLLPEFWLVDPLDGTKNFLNYDEDFAINIALIQNNRPVIGLIAIPMLGISYRAAAGCGAEKRTTEGVAGISCSESLTNIWLASRRNDKPAAKTFHEANGIPDERIMRVGSSLKYCLIAEGRADGYARPGGNSEWDTAPGDLLLAEAGGRVIDYKDGSALKYNKPLMRNNGFIACSAAVLAAELKRP